MPKNKVKTVPVCKKIFINVLKKKNYTIQRFCETEGVCSDRTLRRMLDAGEIRPEYLDLIARKLNVDPRFLSGQLQMGYEHVKAEETPTGNTARLNIEDFPYFRKIRDVSADNKFASLITGTLVAFDIDPEQYERLKIDEQCSLVHEVIDALYKVYSSHFIKDGLGNKGLPAIYELEYMVECMKDNYEEESYVEQVLRPKYLKKPPKGMTAYQIKRMPYWKLMDLDYSEKLAKNPPKDDEEDLFSRKYKDLLENPGKQKDSL